MSNKDHYRSELETQRAILMGKVSAYQSMRGEMSRGEKKDFKQAKYELRSVRTSLAQLDNDHLDTRGDYGQKFNRTNQDEHFTSYLRGRVPAMEYRGVLDSNSLSTAPNSSGVAAGVTGYDAGYMIPQGFWGNLQVALKAYGGCAFAFRTINTATGNPMPWPTIDPTGITAKYITEINQLGFGGDSNGTDYQFGQGMLNAWTIVSGVVLASVQLVQDSAFDVDNFVSDRVGEAIGRKLAAEAINGTGSSACLGINTALNVRGSAGTVGSSIAATGGYVTLSAGQTVKNFSGSSPTELSGNILSPATAIAMVSAVDPAYYPNCAWFMNAQQAWNMRTVSDANSRPLLDFQNGFNADDVTNPNYNSASAVGQLLGFPVVIDNNIANLTASTTGGPIFGDLSRAMVTRLVGNESRITAEHPQVQTMRLTERYADYLQVGYIGYLRVDMRSNDLRAAVTVKAAAT